MPFLVELGVIILRVLLLFLGVLFSIILGNKIYFAINDTLQLLLFPCLEIISVLVLLFLPVGIFYGMQVRKYFWNRTGHYNLRLSIFALVAGCILALIPIGNSVYLSFEEAYADPSVINSCLSSPVLTIRLAHIIGSGLIASLFALIGMDIGVSLKYFHHWLKPEKKNKLRSSATLIRSGKK